MPAGVHTGKSLTGQRRQEAITRLANDESCRSIARALRVSDHTIAGIAVSEWREVAQRKPILADLHEENALYSLRELNGRLRKRPDKFSVLELNVVAGTATDKSLALRGDPSLTIRHEHLHAQLSDDDVWSYMIAKSREAKGKEEERNGKARALTNSK